MFLTQQGELMDADERYARLLAREKKGKEAVAALASQDDVDRVQKRLLERAAEHTQLAVRLANVGMFCEAHGVSLTARAALTAAEDLHQAYARGRPKTFVARMAKVAEMQAPSAYQAALKKKFLATVARKERAMAKKQEGTAA